LSQTPANRDRRPKSKPGTSRRKLLRGIGLALAATTVQAPFVRTARAARGLKVSTYGGYFERGFALHVFPAFTKATGIEVQSIEQPEGAQFLFQLMEANKAGKPPMDICCAADVDTYRGRAQNLWRVFDASRIPNLSQLPPRFIMGQSAGPDSVGAMSWYMTLVVNTEEVKPLPDSWSVLWGKHPNDWGIETGSVSLIFEIAAALHFGGTDILASKEGIDKVIAKIAELKPNVKLWWQDEGTMQTALVNDEVAGGIYMHDTAMQMIRNGTPVRSIFPKEGAVMSTNYWCQPSASTKVEEAQEFLNFSCTPEAQELIARFVGSAPVLDRTKLDLTDQEFAAVSSDKQAIYAATEARFKFTDYMEQQFTKMVTS
jgi:putative spermidine/putrescine transport system substrate-binding protein